MRALLRLALAAALFVGAGCELLVTLLGPDTCEEAPPSCDGEVIVLCLNDVIVREDCADLGLVCNAALGECSACGNGVLEIEAGEDCDLGAGNSDAPDAECRLDCTPRRCGDGVADPAFEEACDDGDNLSGDGCSADCSSLEICGNAVVDAGEACDDGNALGGDGCAADCAKVEICGDALVDEGEACDDGNTLSGDGCRADCQKVEVCGDAIVDANEECDDGNQNNADDCDTDCQNLGACGDGALNGGELCDDGNNLSGDGCRADCLKIEECGDAIVDANEECDDGNADNTDACLADCAAPSCGDGFERAGVEQCDDGGTAPNDGCAAGCQLEADIFVRCGGAPGAGALGSLANPFPTVGAALGDPGTTDGKRVMVLPPSVCNEKATITRSISLFGLADPFAVGAPARPTVNGGANPALEITANNLSVTIADLKLLAAKDNVGALNVTGSSRVAAFGLDAENTTPNAEGLRYKPAAASQLLVDRSFFHGNGKTGVLVDGQGRGVIANSLFQDNGVGVTAAGGGQVTALASTFDLNPSGAIKCPGGGTGRLDSSIVNDNNGNVTDDCPITFTDTFDVSVNGQGNIDEDPEFVLVNGSPFHLASSSPCRNAGRETPLSLLPFDPQDPALFGFDIFDHDFEGDSRPKAGVPDMGMFED
jgi:cysteine-rich repeat protein